MRRSAYRTALPGLCAVALACACGTSLARGGSHSTGGHSNGGHHSSSEGRHSVSTGSATEARSSASEARHYAEAKSQAGTRASPGVARDSHGRIARSTKAKDDFKRTHPCPSTGRSTGACPGYVIDHVQALKHGGADSPSNMQWQTTADAKAKDRVE